MTILLRKQVITGKLSNSSLTGTLKIPRQGIAGTLVQALPSLVSGAIKLPVQSIAGELDNPPLISGDIRLPSQILDGVLYNVPSITVEIGLPMQRVAGTFHYVYHARRQSAAPWYLNETTVLWHTAPADVGILARRRSGCCWWLTQPVAAMHGQGYDIGLWARSTLQVGYSIRVGRGQTARWSLPVSARHAARYGCRAERVFRAGYTLLWPLRHAHTSIHTIRDTDPVRRVFHAGYSLRVGVEKSVAWGSLPRVRKSGTASYAALVTTARIHRGGFDLRPGDTVTGGHAAGWQLRLGKSLTVPYAPATRLAAQLAARHDLRPPIGIAFAANWSLTEAARSVHRGNHDLTEFNRARASLRSHFGASDLAPLIGVMSAPVLRLGLLCIDLITASIGVDEPSPWWMARIEIAHLADFGRLTVGDDVTLEFGDVVFALVLDGKHLLRSSPSGLRLEVTARSPLAALAPPLGPSITRSFADATQAEAAVRELLSGIRLEWQLPEWWIPAGRLAAVQANPVEIARNIARAAGGVLDSLPDGRVIARPLYPVSLPDYARAAVSRVLSDDDLFEAEEALEVRTGINRLRVADGDTTATMDRVEFIPDDNDTRQGVVRVAPSPWRALSLAHTGDASVSVLPLGERLHEEVERVEFKAGVATLAWPVEVLRAVRWQHRDLGSVSFTRGGVELRVLGAGSAEGYSLAEIRYAVRVLEWKVANVRDEATQFLVLEQ